MSKQLRKLAMIVIFAFMANVQAWALNVDSEVRHYSSVSSQSDPQYSEHSQHKCHDCEKADHHCCHAINHLLGQVSDSFVLAQISKKSDLIIMTVANVTSTDPEDIYHPPRTPSLT